MQHGFLHPAYQLQPGHELKNRPVATLAIQSPTLRHTQEYAIEAASLIAKQAPSSKQSS
jgi:hypothetical protein